MPDHGKKCVLRPLGAVLAADALVVEAEPDVRRRGQLRRHLAAHAVALLQMSLDEDRLSVDVRIDDQGRPVVVCVVD